MEQVLAGGEVLAHLLVVVVLDVAKLFAELTLLFLVDLVGFLDIGEVTHFVFLFFCSLVTKL